MTGSNFKFDPVILPLFFFGAVLATYLVRHHIFFWDTVQLGSKHAHFYYENSFSPLLLPEAIDSGHPPTFGLYLAFLWTIFGKTLPVSHFAMLPFLFGILYFSWQLGKYFGKSQYAFFLLLMAVVDPTLAAQCVLVSPDVVLVCFFLMGIYAILHKRNWLKVLAMLGLAMISMRGMMTVAALFTFEIAFHFSSWRLLPKLILQTIGFYVPAGLFGLAFLSWHYTRTGWIGYHADSPWAPSFSKTGISGFVKNLAVLGWRMLDFGRIFVWLPLIFVAFKTFTKVKDIEHVRTLALLLLSCLLFLTPTLLLYQGLSAHRYLLPVFLTLSMLCYTLLIQAVRQNKGWIALVIIGLASGNFWIYPDKIAQGWDATLAHLPYYEVRAKMVEYIQNQAIPLQQIGTAFPEIGSMKFRDLSGKEEGFLEKNLDNQSYILYSNVMNDFTDSERTQLSQQWLPMQTFSKGGVRMVLYQKIIPSN